MRVRHKKNYPSLIFKTAVIMIGALVIFMIGFGYGQQSAYNKINDDTSLNDIYKYEKDDE